MFSAIIGRRHSRGDLAIALFLLRRFATFLLFLETAAKGNGALTFVPDGDGVIRRVPLVLALDGQPVSTLTAELLRVGQGERNIVLRAAEEKDTGLAEVRIGAYGRGNDWLTVVGTAKGFEL